MFARLGLALLLAVPVTVMAADNSLPIVSEVTENTAGTQITIIGNGAGMPADGRLLPIAQYQALFSLIGTTYGGDGMSTLPSPTSAPSLPKTWLTPSAQWASSPAGIESSLDRKQKGDTVYTASPFHIADSPGAPYLEET
jgi:hypothetical protein